MILPISRVIADSPPVRRGARRLRDIPPDVLEALNNGTMSTVNHVEHMATDQGRLWAHAFPQLSTYRPAFSGCGFMDRLRLGGAILYREFGAAAWTSDGAEIDMVKAWRAFAVGAAQMRLSDRLDAIRPFALDSHFGVREWAWLAVRPAVNDQPMAAIRVLATSEPWREPRWRRFACEVTRPRSVWGRHITVFKRHPEHAEPLLCGLLSDDDDYVLTSLTNWLNDVSSDHVEWVRQLCGRVTRTGRRNDAWMLARSTRKAAAKPVHVSLNSPTISSTIAATARSSVAMTR